MMNLRLAFRDLSAAAAFGSMAISGALPLWAVVVFELGLLLALLGRRVFANHGGWVLWILGFALILLYATVASGKVDLVLAACTFAELITLFRMLALPTPQTDNQVHLSSLLMVAGGAALSADLLYAPFLAIYAVLTMLSLGLGTLAQDPRTDTAPDEPALARQAVRQLMLGAGLAILGSAVFFAAFPRLSWSLAGRRSSRALGGAVTGLSDRVRLGGDGSIKTSPRVVARARLSPDPNVSELNRYWFARAFDSFNGSEWTTQVESRPPDPVVPPKNVVRQNIEVLPAYGSRTAIALERPLRYLSPMVLTSTEQTPARLLELGGGGVQFDRAAVEYHYVAESSPSPLAAESQGGGPEYLQLPPNLDPRVANLAKRIVGGESDPLAAGQRLESYLKSRYQYSLALSGNVSDPLVDFLFQRRAGHCEDFATALTVLLRTLRIPARIVTGFYGGERVGDLYVIRAGDAHTWTQVLLAGKGFVSLDATPEAHRPGQPSAVLDWLTRFYEVLDMRWRNSVVEYSLKDQAQLARQVARAPWALSVSLPKVPRWALGLVALAALAGGAWRRARGRSKTQHEATDLLNRLERILRRAHLGPRDGEDAQELTSRLAGEKHPLAVPVKQAVHRYLDARFGHRPLAPGEARYVLSRLQRELFPIR